MQVDESKFFLQPFYPQEVIDNFQNFDKWFSKINLHSNLNTMDITTQRQYWQLSHKKYLVRSDNVFEEKSSLFMYFKTNNSGFADKKVMGLKITKKLKKANPRSNNNQIIQLTNLQKYQII